MMSDLLATPSPPAALRRVSAATFRRALELGVARVLAHRELLDRINVFPVPDGDTGANLAHTLRAMLAALPGAKGAHLGSCLKRLADSALDGARGNSGAILAQYLLGFSAAAAPHRHLDLAALAEAAAAGERAAYAAVASPREGTMLSVMRAFTAELLEQARKGADDLAAALKSALEGARKALAETPEKLAELRAAGVVDAGAKGFVEFVAGMLELLGGRRPRLEPALVKQPASLIAAATSEAVADDTRFRYCCECVLSGVDLAIASLRDALTQLPAESVVIAGSREKLRIHGHTDDPAAFFALAARFGKVAGCKADDMRTQQNRAATLALLADSGADLPDELFAASRVHLVPVRVAFGEEEFLDKLGLHPDEFFARLRASGAPPRTSQPPPADFQRAFEFLLSHHRGVLGVHLSRRLSGTMQSAEAAARRASGRVRLVDSENASAGQGLLVAYAAEAIAAGLSLDEAAVVVEAMVPRTRSYAVLQDLGHAERGGRLPRLARWLGEGLNLRPVLTNRQGRLGIAGALWARRRRPERFAEWVLRRLDRGRSYRALIAHADDAQAALQVRARLARSGFGFEMLEIVPLGSAIAAHAGPGALLVAVQDYEPPLLLLERLRASR